MKRGQSTVEFALVVPFVAGLLALTLQGGLILSDQVNLQHFTYDAGQWAQANPQMATPDTAGVGAVTQHVYDQTCGPGLRPGALGGKQPLTRFCTTDLVVSVRDRSTPVSAVHPSTGVLAAAAGCPATPWVMTVTPSDLQTVDASVTGGTQNFTVKVAYAPQPSPSPTASATPSPAPSPPPPPVVALSVSITDAFVGSSGFSQQNISPGGPDSSTLAIAYTTNTRPDTYTIEVTGADQCGLATTSTIKLLVKNNPLTVSPGPSPPITEFVGSVNPPQPCAAVAATLTISGGGFVPGVTVNVGGTAATVTYQSANTLSVTLPSVPGPGFFPVTVTYPDGVKATLINAINSTAACPVATASPPPPPPACVSAVAPSTGGVGAPNQLVVSLTWKEPLIIPLVSGGTLALSANAYVFCST